MTRDLKRHRLVTISYPDMAVNVIDTYLPYQTHQGLQGVVISQSLVLRERKSNVDEALIDRLIDCGMSLAKMELGGSWGGAGSWNLNSFPRLDGSRRTKLLDRLD